MAAPTRKQLEYIIDLCGGRREDDAYREITKDISDRSYGSLKAVKRGATRRDASRTIDRLLGDD